MTNIARPPQDPLGFTAPIEHKSGEVWLDVVHQWHDPWHTTVTTAFRSWNAPKPNLTYQRQFYMRSNDQHPNSPLSNVTCITRHAGKNELSTAAVHLEVMMNAVQVQAQKDGIMLYELDDPAIKPYWNTEFDKEVIGDLHRRFTAGLPTYRPGESIPEPLAVAIQHELLNGDHGFQLTTDPNAPTVEFVKIVKDSHYHWHSLEMAAEHMNEHPSPAMHLELMVSTNHGIDQHRLFPTCIPINDKWAALTTNNCPPEHISRLLAKANTTLADFEEYDKDTPHSEYVEDIMSEASSRAYNTLYPKNGQLATFLSKAIRDASRKNLEAPQEPVTIVSTESSIALIAHHPEKPHTAVPTKLLAELEKVFNESNSFNNHEQRLLRIAPVARRIIDLKPKWYRTPADEQTE